MSILKRYVELHPGSRTLASRAAEVFPNGVTHDIRHNAPFPLYVRQASGSHKTDVDGNELVDYVMGHGALLPGHNEPRIMEAVEAQLSLGTHFGASHEAEIRWGELVLRLVPSAERVRFTSSGTEATMMALRLARAYTGREKVLRLREHFHGWNDSVMGQPDAEGTLPASPGLPHGTLEASIVVAQNDAETLERTLREDGGDIAAMILEPTGAHWGTEPIDLGFVRAARELTARHGVVLIFDEVITGFRVSPGGAQQAYGITPDMTTMAKIVAGGLPGGCVAGRAEIIEQIAIRDSVSRAYTPGGRISHPGTFNANPLSAVAGATCLAIIADGTPQQRAADTAATLARDLNGVLRDEHVRGCVYGFSSMLHIALGATEPPPDGYSWGGSAPPTPIAEPPKEASHALKLGMINEGVHLMDGGMMVSSAHTADDVGRTVEAFRNTLRAMRADGALD
ncbi:MAG TPA: aspartate aminotransferase family protein [Dehalococcoidia bacterium]|nr:aspartate aminotransferase family protein [Dehalococcoidia bacterium]